LKGYDPDVHEVGPEKFVGLAKANHAHVTLGFDSTVLASDPTHTVVVPVKQYITVMRGQQKGQSVPQRGCLRLPVRPGACSRAGSEIPFHPERCNHPNRETFQFRSKVPFSEWVRKDG